MSNALKTLYLILLLSFATESEARAYADPGSGALIWQGLLATMVGAVFYLRRFTAWFRSKKQPGKED